MKKYLTSSLIVLVFLLTFSGSLYAFPKVGTTSFQFLEVLTSARGSALGNAFSSMVDNSEAEFYNPAGLTGINNIDLSVGYVNWFLDAAQYSFAAGYYLDGYGVLGFQAMFTDVGTIGETRVDALGFQEDGSYNGLTGRTFRPNSIVVGVSFARDLTDRLSLGVTAKFVHENLVYKSASALAFDGGLLFKTGFRNIVIDATIRHFGQQVKYIDEAFPLPQTFTIGVSSFLLSDKDPLIAQSDQHSVRLAYEMVQPRDYDQQHSVGMEYSFENMFFLRGGYQFNTDEQSWSVGMGLQYDGLRVDYSYNDFGQYLDAVHRITIGYAIK
ncbi:MAG: PorV/PorQ family protein [Ignavibacteriaceae bacterium]|nr:PorV/PorQ family protein [Ignavibacteriaceae bacterium]